MAENTHEITHIICRRTPAGPEVVMECAGGAPGFILPHAHVCHSPSGFEWGYGGSGPADLALNILAQFVDIQLAHALHQDFKWRFIAPMPYQGGSIQVSEILNWLLSHIGEGAVHA